MQLRNVRLSQIPHRNASEFAQSILQTHIPAAVETSSNNVFQFHFHQFPNHDELSRHLLYHSKKFETVKKYFYKETQPNTGSDEDSKDPTDGAVPSLQPKEPPSLVIAVVHFVSASHVGSKAIFETKWLMERLAQLLEIPSDREKFHVAWRKHMLAETFYNVVANWVHVKEKRWHAMHEIGGIVSLCKALCDEPWSFFKIREIDALTFVDIRDLCKCLMGGMFTNPDIQKIILQQVKPSLKAWIQRLPEKYDQSGGYSAGTEMIFFVILFLQLLVDHDKECANILKIQELHLQLRGLIKMEILKRHKNFSIN